MNAYKRGVINEVISFQIFKLVRSFLFRVFTLKLVWSFLFQFSGFKLFFFFDFYGSSALYRLYKIQKLK